MTKKYYAIVSTTQLKFKKQWRFPTMNAQLPIYWNRKVARETCLKYGGKTEVIEIEL